MFRPASEPPAHLGKVRLCGAKVESAAFLVKRVIRRGNRKMPQCSIFRDAVPLKTQFVSEMLLFDVKM
ncbi:hypothetical protein [Sphingobium algorifonticola]|uniref:hypothetical protein n=1 Tax=Sphingobium algorifonticola TaxID=2008318 RepID=UPI0013E3F30F|nr:hypothetical protein [Sphingobium algorifonticola]